ncbi:PKD domain-containing protein [Litoribacter populi]|uniref:PKD domain-containing protein n=1 Tax=Litoribacter populi TaxID=2598460 RepID=UPI001180A2B8|nr:PKD domain-containing protein [Litoribacter populi]
MIKLKAPLIVFLILLFSCSPEDQNPTLQADFELAQPDFIVGEPLIIEEVTLRGVRYDWDFGNGLTSNEQRPNNIVYEEAGVFTITLTVMSTGGSQTTSQKDVIIGQYHANSLELNNIFPEYRNRDMDIYFTVNQITSPHGSGEILESEIYRSEVFSSFNSQDLPISWEVENIPLGGNGYSINQNPRIRFFDANTDEVIAHFGSVFTLYTSYGYDPDRLTGSFNAVSNGDGSLGIRYNAVYP